MKNTNKITEPKTMLKVNNSTIGEPLVCKLRKILDGGSGIEKVKENTYAGQYVAGADIRTDRWEIALDAKIKGDIISNREAEQILQKAANPIIETNNVTATETKE